MSIAAHSIKLSRMSLISDTYTVLAHQSVELEGRLDAIRRALRIPRPRARSAWDLLPGDVLSHVFFQLLELSNSTPRDTCILPFTLSYVCKRWRDCALGLPALWTKIYALPKERGWFRRMEICLARSGKALLDVNLDFSLWTGGVLLSAPYVEMGAAQRTYIAAVAAHSSRWRSLEIYFQNQKQRVDAAGCLADVSVPNLEDLKVKMSTWGSTDHPDVKDPDGKPVSRAVFTGGAPSLRSVKYQYIALMWFLPPLANVQILEFDGGEYPIAHTREMFHHLLSTPTALRNLHISGAEIKERIDEAEQQQILEMPHLTSLSIGGNSLSAFGLLFGPQLRTLNIEGTCGDLDSRGGDLQIEAYLRALSDIPGTRFPLLATLSLTNFECEDMETCLHFLQKVLTIETLGIWGERRWHVIRALCAKNKDGAVKALPNLRALATNTLPWTSFCELVMLRGRARALQTIDLSTEFIRESEGDATGMLSSWAQARDVTIQGRIMARPRYRRLDEVWTWGIASWKQAPEGWSAWEDDKLRAQLKVFRRALVEATRKAREEAERRRDEMEVDD